MSRLIIMRGLPASGKSTRAREIMEESGNCVRLNKDLLREMLHFNKWSGTNESRTQAAELALAEYYITKTNLSVIIDDTNLNLNTFNKWVELTKRLGISHKIEDMNISIQECLNRDLERKNAVGSDVIINMARRNGLYQSIMKDVIVDIDGTLCDITHRLHFVKQEPKDWPGFFGCMADDLPRMDIIKKVRKLSKFHNIVLVSGRPERYKDVTKAWLKKHKVPYETIIMRSERDTRPDNEVKQDILNAYFDKRMIDHVIDDRPRVIRMWQENGLKVEDVGNGVEF